MVLPAILLAAGCSTTGTKEKERHVRGGAVAVEIFVTKSARVDFSLGFAGTLKANEETEIRPETDGRVVSIAFSEGQVVRKGTLLLKTDDSELQAQLRQNTVLTDQARREMNRRKELLKSRGISQEEYDAAQVKFESLEAEQELIKVKIAKTEIRAAFTGTVGLRMVSEGAYVNSSTLITTLQQVDPVKIEFSVPEQYFGSLKQGIPVEFSVEGSDRLFKGEVYAIDPRIEETTRTIRLRARCSNPDGYLLPGAFARVKFDLVTEKESIIIPARAIIPVLNGQQVFVVEKGIARTRDVTIGRRMAGEVEVTGGLNSGDSLVLSGLLQIKPGSSVIPQGIDTKQGEQE